MKTTTNTRAQLRPNLQPIHHHRKVNPLRHLQGWTFQNPPRHFQGWSYQNHQIRQYRKVQKNPLHNAQGPTTHQSWTQRPSPVALAHKPRIPLASSPLPKRPSAGTHASFSKVSLCLSSTKRPDNPYNIDNCVNTPSSPKSGTPPTPKNSAVSAKVLEKVLKAHGSSA